MLRLDKLPKDRTDRFRHLLRSTQSGELQAAVVGNGRFGYNPYYFHYRTNLEISELQIILNVAMPLLRDLGGDRRKVAFAEIVEGTEDRVSTYLSENDDVGEIPMMRATASMGDALRTADSLNLLVKSPLPRDEGVDSSQFILTREGSDTDTEWLYSPYHNSGCLGGLAIGGAMTGVNAYYASRFGINPINLGITFGSFSVLGTGATKSLAAKQTAKNAYRANLARTT